MEFTELKGLKGGDKQAWINRNLDLIALLNQSVGFEATRTALYMKSETLEAALRKAEGRHRPAITEANKAYNKASIVENNLYEITQVVQDHGEKIMQLAADQVSLRDVLGQFFAVQSNLNGMMAKLVSNESNFTEHTSRANKNKVGLTTRKGSGRLFLSTSRERLQPARPVEKQRHRKPYRGYRAVSSRVAPDV